MNPAEAETIKFKHSRFTARLLTDRLYTPSHFWLKEEGSNRWRIGFTRFAKRMLGEIVEMDFEVKSGSEVTKGQIVGWVEAFKAVTDLYSVMPGKFVGGNDALIKDPSVMEDRFNGDVWLYEVAGKPDEDAMTAEQYADSLRETIDKLRGTMYDSEADTA